MQAEQPNNVPSGGWDYVSGEESDITQPSPTAVKRIHANEARYAQRGRTMDRDGKHKMVEREEGGRGVRVSGEVDQVVVQRAKGGVGSGTGEGESGRTGGRGEADQ
eukprot:scaffold100851_cov18-Tisochrysis_lutea.AAC.2